jgi:hypothetical protein
VRTGDLAVPDATERDVVVIPRDKLIELLRIFSGLKEAYEGVLRNVGAGVGFRSDAEVFRRHRVHDGNASQWASSGQKGMEAKKRPRNHHQAIERRRKENSKRNQITPSSLSSTPCKRRERKKKKESPSSKLALPLPIKEQ